MSDWVPVDFRLPADDVGVLVYRFGCRRAYLRDGKWYACWDAKPLDHVTHWMPFPDPPSAEDRQ